MPLDYSILRKMNRQENAYLLADISLGSVAAGLRRRSAMLIL